MGEAIYAGYAAKECFLLYHLIRYYADELATIRDLTKDWNDTRSLTDHIEANRRLREQRKHHLDEGLQLLFHQEGHTEEAFVFSQIANMEQNQGHANILGLAMFYAVMSGAMNPSGQAHRSSITETQHLLH